MQYCICSIYDADLSYYLSNGMTYYSFCDVANETSFWCSVIVDGCSFAELNIIGNKLLFSFMDVNITVSRYLHKFLICDLSA